uniref:Uncharacterized protein n=1 Tax=Anguilla anguilla TaxID=7936 RepID=A0A0E9RMY8_ANGAN
MHCSREFYSRISRKDFQDCEGGCYICLA